MTDLSSSRKILLSDPIKERVLPRLSFEELVNFRNAMNLASLKREIQIPFQDKGYTFELVLSGINDDTIRTVELLKNSGITGILTAARNNEVKIVKVFLNAYRGDQNFLNTIIKSMFEYALRNNAEQVVQLLFNRVDQKIKERRLREAVRKDNFEITKILLDLGVNPNAQFDNDTEDILYVAIKQRIPEIVQLLINAGVDVNAYQTIKNQTPLSTIIDDVYRDYSWESYWQIISLLLEAGADPNVVFKDGFRDENALTLAIKRNVPEVVELLLEFGADPNGKLDPLHIAIIEDDEDIVRLLIEAGANVNSYQTYNDTPLTIAITNQHYYQDQIIDLLLAAGADPYLTGKSNRNAIQAAREFGYQRLFELLKIPY